MSRDSTTRVLSRMRARELAADEMKLVTGGDPKDTLTLCTSDDCGNIDGDTGEC